MLGVKLCFVEIKENEPLMIFVDICSLKQLKQISTNSSSKGIFVSFKDEAEITFHDDYLRLKGFFS